MSRYCHSFFLLLTFLLISISCSKEVNLVPKNDSFASFNISDIKIGNYVHRIYIDIIGREPLKDELALELEWLKSNDLSRESRDSIITKLMNDTTYRPNEFSYKAAYIQNLYNLAKIRCLENVTDPEIRRFKGIKQGAALRDSLTGNWEGYYEKLNAIRKYQLLLDSRQALYDGLMEYHTMYAFIIDNGVYDRINMNTFNYVRATMDDLLWRLPTVEEYDATFNMIEHDRTREFFGQIGSSKNDYIRILINSTGMYEGMIIWAYQVFLNRQPTPVEMITLMEEYTQTKSINSVISKILVTDEYANFR